MKNSTLALIDNWDASQSIVCFSYIFVQALSLSDKQMFMYSMQIFSL